MVIGLSDGVDGGWVRVVGTGCVEGRKGGWS